MKRKTLKTKANKALSVLEMLRTESEAFYKISARHPRFIVVPPGGKEKFIKAVGGDPSLTWLRVAFRNCELVEPREICFVDPILFKDCIL